MIIFPDISPEIFSISVFGLSFSVRWYALSYIVGILLAWRMALVALRRAELWPKNLAPMAARDFEDLLTWMILGILLGGRLGYVLFYQPAYITLKTSTFLRQKMILLVKKSMRGVPVQ